MSRRGGKDEGQATVETALVLPVLVVFALLIAQVGLVVRAQITVIHAAREAARVVAVDPTADATNAALRSGTLDPARTTVTVSGALDPGSLVTVEVSYIVSSTLPVVGGLVGDVAVSGEATMLVEGLVDSADTESVDSAGG